MRMIRRLRERRRRISKKLPRQYVAQGVKLTFFSRDFKLIAIGILATLTLLVQVLSVSNRNLSINPMFNHQSKRVIIRVSSVQQLHEIANIHLAGL